MSFYHEDSPQADEAFQLHQRGGRLPLHPQLLRILDAGQGARLRHKDARDQKDWPERAGLVGSAIFFHHILEVRYSAPTSGIS